MSRPPTRPGPFVGSARTALVLAARTGTWHLVAYLSATVTVACLPVAGAWLTKEVLDRITAPEPRSGTGLLAAAAALAGIGVVSAAVLPSLQYLRQSLHRRVSAAAQDRLYAAVNADVGLSRFEDPRRLDELRIAEQAARSAPAQVVDGLLELIRAALTTLGLLSSVAVISRSMAVIVAAGALPGVLAAVRLSERRSNSLWRIGPVERREMFYANLLGTVAAAKEIRLFDFGGFLRRRMIAERYAGDRLKSANDRRELALHLTLGVLGTMVTGVGLVATILAARDGRLTAGDVSMFITAVVGAQAGAIALVDIVYDLHGAVRLFDRYCAVTASAPDQPRTATPVPIPSAGQGLVLSGVWFRYDDDHDWILRGVDLCIPERSSLALVGRNGAGKSTLIKLICRFYDPTRGSITWNGVDLRDMSVEHLRRQIAAVFQDFMCYDLTAAENIAVGDVIALRQHDRVERAAELADIHRTLSGLPSGYRTMLTRTFFDEGDRDDPDTGVVLSGGQWQRLAVARALLRDWCPLIVLDEPSAGLDAEAEADLYARLRELRLGRTSILVSHRLNAVTELDQIVVLDGGRIVEQGTHQQLISHNGRYAHLFTLQARHYTSAPTP